MLENFSPLQIDSMLKLWVWYSADIFDASNVNFFVLMFCCYYFITNPRKISCIVKIHSLYKRHLNAVFSEMNNEKVVILYFQYLTKYLFSDPVFVFPCEDGHVTCLDCFRQYCSSRLRDRQFWPHPDFGYTLGCPAGCENSFIEEPHHFRLLSDIQVNNFTY